MSRSKDPLALRPHWHVDYRIEAELPDDTLIGTRFLVNLGSSGVALMTLLLTGWFGYMTWNLSNQIHDWERRINDNRAEVTANQAMQKEYTIESMKIDQAYAMVAQPFFVSDLVVNLGRTRPDQMSIDLIEWNEGGIVLRGGLREKSGPAMRILSSYIDVLRKDEKISPLFQKIVTTDTGRGAGGDTQRFEIRFTLKDRK